MSDNTTVPASDQVVEDDFDKASTAGWTSFTRFLLINVILCALGLAFVALFTVWA